MLQCIKHNDGHLLVHHNSYKNINQNRKRTDCKKQQVLNCSIVIKEIRVTTMVEGNVFVSSHFTNTKVT